VLRWFSSGTALMPWKKTRPQMPATNRLSTIQSSTIIITTPKTHKPQKTGGQKKKRKET
jgi:hypothetical protein